MARRKSEKKKSKKKDDKKVDQVETTPIEEQPKPEPITELVLVNKRIRSRDVFPPKGTFLDVAKELWAKYKDTLTEHGEANVDNLIPDEDRMPLRFMYVDKAGSQCLIEASEPVEAILAAGAEQVNWDHVPVGGGLNYRQAFGRHALDLMSIPQYQNWKNLHADHPGYGITATGPDKNDVVRTLKLTPSGNYPKTPPTVTAEPEFTDDPCWSGGVLHFTNFRSGGGSAWDDLVDLSSVGINPLQGLIQELLQKYGFAV
jgi:hypothetical protein